MIGVYPCWNSGILIQIHLHSSELLNSLSLVYLLWLMPEWVKFFFEFATQKEGLIHFSYAQCAVFFLAHLSLFDWNWASNLLDSLFSFSPFSLDSREFYAGNGYKKNHWFFWLRIYVEIFLMIEGEVFIPAITINSSYLFSNSVSFQWHQ